MRLLTIKGIMKAINNSHKEAFPKLLSVSDNFAKELQAVAKAQDTKTAKEMVEWVEQHSIWAQVPFAVIEEERTLRCIDEDDWQAFKKGKL